MRGQKEKKQSPLATWGGCQEIKYCSEFQYEVWNESQLQLIHWEERSRMERQIGRKRLQREGEQMMLQRKGGSLGHSKPLGIPFVEKKYIIELFHSYPLLWPLKGTLYTPAVPPMLSIKEGLTRDVQLPCSSWLSLCPLPVKILRAWRGSKVTV